MAPAGASPQTLSLVDQIVAQLTTEIITAQVVPGERLRDSEIALRLGTSRAPVREAFRVLEREGLIELQAWHGARVARPTLGEIQELFDIRAELFGVCARRFTARAGNAQIERVRQEIRDLIEQTEAGCDERVYKTRTNSISEMISSQVGNSYLTDAMAGLRRKMFWYYCFLGTSTFERRRDSNRIWSRLAQALLDRDAATAETAAFGRVTKQVKMTRYGLDCYAYALLALGQVDLVIEAGLQSYDIAAPIGVIEAAGGIVTDWQGGPATQGGQVIAAGSPELHRQALDLLNG